MHAYHKIENVNLCIISCYHQQVLKVCPRPCSRINKYKYIIHVLFIMRECVSDHNITV